MENSCVTLLDTPAAGISFAESADQKSTFSVGVQHFPRSSYVNENLPNWIGERLLVTVQGVAIHCIDSKYGKCQKSWSLSRQTILTQAAIAWRDSVTEKTFIYALILKSPENPGKEKSQWVWIWDKKDTVDGCRKHKLPKPVKKLCVFGEDSLVAVYEDGTVEIMLPDLQTVKHQCQPVPAGAQIEQISTAGLNKMSLVWKNSQGTRFVSVLQYVNEQYQHETRKLSLSASALPLLSITPASKSDQISIVADNRWRVYDHNETHEYLLEYNWDCSNSTLAVCALPNGYTAFLEKASTNQMRLVIRDQEYAVARSVKLIDKKINDATSVSLTYLRNESEGSRLVVLCDGALWVFPVFLRKATLLDAIKQNKQHLLNNGVVTPQLSRKSSTSEMEEIQKKLCDPKETPSIRAFETCYSHAKHPIQIPQWMEDCYVKTPLNVQSEHSTIDSIVLDAVVDRLSQEENFWPESTIKDLLKRRVLKNRHFSGQFVSNLMKRRQIWLLHECCQYVDDLSEVDLVRMLKFFISGLSNQDAEMELESHLAEMDTSIGHIAFPFHHSVDADLGVETAQEYMIRVILTSPVSETFLPKALKRFDSSEISFMFQFLKKWMKRFQVIGQETLESWMKKVNHDHPSVSRPLTLECLCTFTTSFIDANLTQLLFSSAYHDDIYDLIACVRSQSDICRELDSVRGILQDACHVKEENGNVTVKKSTKSLSNPAKDNYQLIGKYAVEKFQWW